MSTQKGNSNRSRPQKYRNQSVFKNNLHDKSNKTKLINNIQVANVCERCKNIIEWKIKYKKYKPLKAPSKCIKCEKKTVKQAYHNMCLPCATEYKVCAKCGDKGEIIERKPDKQEAIKLDTELQGLLKELSERKRRTFIRYMNRNGTKKKCNLKKDECTINNENIKEDLKEEQEQNNTVKEEPVSREDLLLKLQSLMIKEEDDDIDDSNTDDDYYDDSDLDPFM